jgi:hypothetical protein
MAGLVRRFGFGALASVLALSALAVALLTPAKVSRPSAAEVGWSTANSVRDDWTCRRAARTSPTSSWATAIRMTKGPHAGNCPAVSSNIRHPILTMRRQPVPAVVRSCESWSRCN